MEGGYLPMVTFAVDARQPDEAVLARAVDLLRRGRVVAYPTDTLYGLAVSPSNPSAVEQLYRIKSRQVDRGIPLIAAGRDQIEASAGPLPPLARTLAARFWPGPLTIVIPAWPELAREIHGGTGTVAIRVPDHAVARALARVFGGPITSTSANRSGQQAPMTAEAVRLALGDDLDGVVDAGATPGGAPSTIVDVSGGAPRLVRDGAVSWERVLECLQ